MAIVVQKSAGNLAALVAGNEFYTVINGDKLMPVNPVYQTISTSGGAILINFTPDAAQDLKGVILALYNTQGDGATARQRNITVELQEDSGGWVTRATKTIDTDDYIPDNTWSRTVGLIDVRFTTPYTVTTDAATWRFRIYHDGTGSGTFYLIQSETGDADDTFHIAYSDTVVTLTSSDVLVLTDKITVDDNLSLASVDTRSGTQTGDHARTNYVSIYGCMPDTTAGTVPQIYIPSSVAADYTLTMTGMFYISSYEIGILAGEDVANPIPAARVFTVFFNASSSTQMPGFKSGGLTTQSGKLSGVKLFGAIPTNLSATLNDDAASGQAEVKVDGDLTSAWSNGDKIEIGGAQFTSGQSNRDWRYPEYREIQSMAFAGGVTTITVTSNLTYNHYTTTGMNVYVTNTTRNIIVKGKDGTWNQESWTDMNGGYIQAQAVRWEDTYQNYVQRNETSDRSASQITGSISIFESCHAHDVGYLFWGNQDRCGSTFDNCTFSSSVTGATVNHYGVYMINCNDITITNMQSHSRINYAIYQQGGDGLTLQNSYIQGNYGMLLQTSASGLLVDNNQFLRCTGGIYMNGIKSMSGTGNKFRKCHQQDNDAVTTERIAGCYVFGLSSGIVSMEDDDGDDSHAFVTGRSAAGIDISFKNATLGSTWNDAVVNEGGATYRSGWLPDTQVRFHDYDTTSGDHRCWFTDGYWVSTGTGLGDTISRTAGAGLLAWRSERFFTNKEIALELTTVVSNGNVNTPITITVYCYIGADAYDAGTNVAPTLTVSGAGSTLTTDTADVTNEGSWQLLSVSVTPTEVGTLTIKLSSQTDASGSDSYVYWDDMLVSYKEPIDLGALDDAYRALPISPPISTLITARGFWAELLTDNQVSGSMGERMGAVALEATLAAHAANFSFTNGNVHSVGMAQSVGEARLAHFPNL